MFTVAGAAPAVVPLAIRAEESKTGDAGPGLTAFFIVALLAVATFLLVRSMLAQIKKVPPTFDHPVEGEAAEGTAADAQDSEPGDSEPGDSEPGDSAPAQRDG